MKRKDLVNEITKFKYYNILTVKALNEVLLKTNNLIHQHFLISLDFYIILFI